jgi:glycosyltransferase involved in cell wall biosynthesis
MSILLYTDNTARHFVTHRLSLAKFARAAGFEIHVAVPDEVETKVIREAGFEVHTIPISRSGINPVEEKKTISAIREVCSRIRPSLIHNITLKPVVYGSMASQSFPGSRVVNAVTGLGYVFTERSLRTSVLRFVIRMIARKAFLRSGVWFIFQNGEDLGTFIEDGLVSKEQAVIIGGSGVPIPEHIETEAPSEVPTILLAARMLWHKGIKEFVEAAKSLKASGDKARFILAGASDPGNPASISSDQLEAWNREGNVQWLGWQEDMQSLLRGTDVACLPSIYREGIPRSLLEAGAIGKPIVTTNIPGCRELVRDGETGFLVPPGDHEALVSALRKLIRDSALRRKMGANGRQRIIAEYSEGSVNRRTVDLYFRALAGDPEGNRPS